MRRLWLAFCVLACGAVIAGCAAAPKTLPPDQLATFRLAGVNVAFDPDARIAWGDGELAYVASKGLPSTEVDQAAATPEGQAYLRNAIASKVKAALQSSRVAERLRGSRPVRLDVTVKQFSVASVVRRAVIGGGHLMIGDVNLVDARTGEIILARPGLIGYAAANAGVIGVIADQMLRDDPADEVVRSYATTYALWLLVG